MHHTLNHFNSKSVKNPYFCLYFQCEKLTGNEIFLSQYISNHLFTLIYHLGLIQDIQYLVSIILNNVTNFHIHTAICFSVIPIFWQMGRSFLFDLPNMADSAIMRNFNVVVCAEILPRDFLQTLGNYRVYQKGYKFVGL